MGMYTEMHLAVTLKEDLPQEVVNVMNFLFNEGDKPTPPVHEFFSVSQMEELWKNV